MYNSSFWFNNNYFFCNIYSIPNSKIFTSCILFPLFVILLYQKENFKKMTKIVNCPHKLKEKLSLPSLRKWGVELFLLLVTQKEVWFNHWTRSQDTLPQGGPAKCPIILHFICLSQFSNRGLAMLGSVNGSTSAVFLNQHRQVYWFWFGHRTW